MSTVISSNLVLKLTPERPTLFADVIITQEIIAEFKITQEIKIDGFLRYGESSTTARGPSVNTELVQGDDIRIIVTVRNQDGQLVNISDVEEITYVIAKRYKGEPAVIKTLTGGGIAITGLNTFNFNVTSADSNSLDTTNYLQECEIVVSGGFTYTALQGRFTVLRQVIN